MPAIPNVPADTSVKDLLSVTMPKIAGEMLSQNSAAAELAGTTITMVVNVEGVSYNYTVKDGSAIECQEGDMGNPMLRLKVSNSDLEKMIQTGNLDMILGIQNDLNRAKYNALTSLKGSFVAEIAADDGHVFKLEAVLNNAEQPRSLFRMSAADTSALMKRETNPVNLFMSGAMKIEGDMAFAMATQPLFT